MSILNSIKNFQEYGNNPRNGYMDNVFLDIVKQKKRLGKTLNKEERKFLASAPTNPNIRKSEKVDAV